MFHDFSCFFQVWILDGFFDGFGVDFGLIFNDMLVLFRSGFSIGKFQKNIDFHRFYSSFRGFSPSDFHVFSCNFHILFASKCCIQV